MENYGTIWVCVDCMLHHANGECGSCHDDEGHDEEPLSSIEAPFTVAMGMGWEDHDDECLTHVINDMKTRHPEIDWPDVPDGYECECAQDTFSTSQCAGCGSWLHGERHAMTLFKEEPRPVSPPVLDDTPTLLRKLYDTARDV